MGLLTELAAKYGTDKWGHHWYAGHYENIFKHLQHERVKLLEIGIGGYEFPERGGASLRMWAEYFRHGFIFGVDVYDKNQIAFPSNVIIQKGDQTDAAFLTKLNTDAGGFDIIIDDGSHLCRHQIKTFEILFPLLKSPGYYIVEDIETSYGAWAGGMEKYMHMDCTLKGNPTALGYFMRMIHEQQYRWAGMIEDERNKSIESIQFFNNFILIKKGENK